MARIVVKKAGDTGFQPVKGHRQDGCATKSVNYFLASVKDATIIIQCISNQLQWKENSLIFFCH